MPSIFSQEDRDRIRTQLLDKGRAMMLERGITKTNIDELAESVGIVKGTFYHFFPSKQAYIDEAAMNMFFRFWDFWAAFSAQSAIFSST